MWNTQIGKTLTGPLVLLLTAGCIPGTSGQVVTRVAGSFEDLAPRKQVGTLVVYTETFEHSDGEILYYPHHSYDVFTPQGEFVKRVTNHLSLNDEDPRRVELAPGTYLIRARTNRAGRPEFLVKIERGRTTVVAEDELFEDSR
jgi:hypothetical protein